MTARDVTVASAGRAAPEPGKRRLVVVDAVRALALFGVIVMNLHSMSGLDFMSAAQLAAVQDGIDRVTLLALQVLVDKKSLSAFSFLFGLSFALMLQRVTSQWAFLPTFLRRMAVLAAFGVLNFTLLYWGDILITYAALGLLLPLAARLPSQALLGAAALLLLGVPIALIVLGLGGGPGGEQTADLEALQAFGSPSFLEAANYGAYRYLGLAESHSVSADWDFVNIFGLFLLGLWVGRAGIPHAIGDHRRLLVRVTAVALLVGCAAALAGALMPQSGTAEVLGLLGRPVLAIGYLAGAALLLDRPSARRIRDLLAPAGRMALTNYLASGLAGQVLFYGWALGLIGRVGTVEVVLLSIAVFILLLALSHAWLHFFRMGPLEWIWRILTRLEMPPLRRLSERRA